MSRKTTTAPTKQQRLCCICGDQVLARAGDLEQESTQLLGLYARCLCGQHMSLASLRFFVVLGLLSDWEDSCWRHHELMTGQLW